jgi:hypothetical protein
MFRNGVMTEAWLRYFQQLFYVGGQVTTNSEHILDLQESEPSFDDRTPRDFTPAIEAAVVRSSSDAPRDFTPAIEAAVVRSSSDAPRDFTPAIEAAQVFHQGDASARVDVDELRALALFATPPGGASGTFTTADGKTVTVQGGQITSIVF